MLQRLKGMLLTEGVAGCIELYFLIVGRATGSALGVGQVIQIGRVSKRV